MRTLIGVLGVGVIVALVWLGGRDEPIPHAGGSGDAPVQEQTDEWALLRGTSSEGVDASDAADPHVGAASADTPPFRIRVLSADGNPIADAQVVRWVGLQERAELGRTDSEGKLQAQVTKGHDSIRVDITAHGFIGQHQQFNRNELNEVRLRPGEVVSGYVRLANTEVGVAGATVRVFTVTDRHEVGAAVQTSADGSFVAATVPPNERMFVVARAEGFHAAAIVRTFPTEKSVVIHVGGGGMLSGRVLDDQGQPVEGIKVWLTRPDRNLPPRQFGGGFVMDNTLMEFAYPQPVTDAQGHYEIRGIALKQPRIPVAQLSERSEVWGTAVTFTGEGQALTQDVVLRVRGSISYRVLDAEGTVLGGDVTVKFATERVWFGADDVENRAPSDDGWFTVADLVPGTWELRAWIPESGHVEQVVEVTAGSNTRVTFAPAAGGEIAGVVVDTQDRPIADVSVSWYDGKTSRRVETDEAGRFRMSSVPLVSGQLKFDTFMMGRGARTRPGQVQIQRGPLCAETLEDVRPNRASLRVVLHEAGRITGNLAGFKEGQRVQSGMYSRFTSGNATFNAGVEGGFSMTAPRYGTPFLYKFERVGFAPRLIECKALKRGEDLDLGTIEFDKGLVLSGVVQDEAGKPIRGAKVKLTDRFLRRDATTGADGAVRFDLLPERTLWIRVDADGKPPHFYSVDARAPTTDTRLRVTSGGTLTGAVFDAEGALVAGGHFGLTWDITSPYDNDLDDFRQSYTLSTGRIGGIRLQAGTYRVRSFTEDNSQHGETRVVIRDGETTEFRLDLAKR